MPLQLNDDQQEALALLGSEFLEALKTELDAELYAEWQKAEPEAAASLHAEAQCVDRAVRRLNALMYGVKRERKRQAAQGRRPAEADK